MKQGNQKKTGGNFERKIALYLSKWATKNPNQKEYIYYRSPSSGAMFTICKANGELSGDLICIKPEYEALTKRYSIECKIGYDKSSFNGVMKNNKDDYIDFWQQCNNDSSGSNKSPMLIFQKKRHNILIGIRLDDKLNEKLLMIKRLTLRFNADIMLPEIAVYDLDEFFGNINYEDLL